VAAQPGEKPYPMKAELSLEMGMCNMRHLQPIFFLIVFPKEVAKARESLLFFFLCMMTEKQYCTKQRGIVVEKSK